MEEHLAKRLAELESVRERVRAGGGPEKTEKHHAAGKLTARERLDLLLDQDSFFEINMLAGHAVNMEAADAFNSAITGFLRTQP